MAFARAVLLIGMLAWAGFGLVLFAWPDVLAMVGLTVDNPLARIEVRGFYGGLELGIAAFLAWCLGAGDRVRPGLVLCGLGLGGAAIGRVLGIGLEGGSTTLAMWGFVATELSGAGLCWIALRRIGLLRDHAPA